MTKGLRIETRGAILEITLDRPKANAIDAATSIELGEAFASFRDNPALRVAIVTGAGDRIFSAGWDLKAAAEQGESENTYQGIGGFAGLTELFDLDKPVIAAVNGIAAGGGFELVLACDLIVAAEAAAFMLPESRVGVIADAGGVQRLPRRLPYFIAMDLLLTGRRMPAVEAAHFGLVNYVVPQAELMQKAREVAASILEAAPLSVSAIKEMLRETERMTVEEAMRATRARKFPGHVRALESEDHIEGPRAFAEKRKPLWKNR